MANESDILLKNPEESDLEGDEEVAEGRTIDTRKIPIGAWALEALGLCNRRPKKRYMYISVCEIYEYTHDES